ncbi:hypothetical protein [Streptomyces sp. NRRL B-3648]|uniref:hypothetical protein n=1 Tax=Streptomyces sp. NRRL B-3648 TaxID=1519493 RepID=UPI0006AF67DF|nr:hypothetical protein [Streptomyces sp. NRRL B-3648]KOX02906.1 hypothetical protein ADL04_11135 [Streptomyces sp. NRRL B-3648]
MNVRKRHLPVAVALVLCSVLTSCGTERTSGPAAGAPTAGSSATEATGDDQCPGTDTTDDDQQIPDTTSDDQGGGGPDLTSDDQGDGGPDLTSDDQGDGGPDLTSDDQGDGGPDLTSDDPGAPCGATAGPHRWFSMTRDFRTYLKGDGRKVDAAMAGHVLSVHVRNPEGTARTEAWVQVTYGVMEEDDADRAAKVFARWRSSVYGDHGHVSVTGPAKTDAESDW